MAATPPLQIRSSVRTPPTPLHGPTFDNLDSTQSRYATRASQRRSSRESLSTPDTVKATPRGRRPIPLAGSSRKSSQNSTPKTAHLHSPQISPRRKSIRRAQVTSPTSPGVDSPAPTPLSSSNPHPTFLSSTTVMADGMLPTPVKTPRKKNVPNVNAAARALFQDQPLLGEEVTANPRRGRKGRRYNGFTLESFSAGEEPPVNIQIFTDSRDNVPQFDTSEDNPFIDHPTKEDGSSSRRVTGTSKRRKVSGEQRVDPQVQQAVDNDEGMIYVFRGKKLYRRFDDASEDEEEIDSADLGLLERNGDVASAAPLKTLTRKSIKPTRLFQTEEEKRTREAEKDEEALTDIEVQPSSAQLASPSTPTKVPGSETPATPPPTGRALRSTSKKEITDADLVGVNAVEKSKAKKPKRASPFDSWKRTKVGATAVAVDLSKSRKRGADPLDEGDAPTSKKAKVD